MKGKGLSWVAMRKTGGFDVVQPITSRGFLSPAVLELQRTSVGDGAWKIIVFVKSVC